MPPQPIDATTLVRDIVRAHPGAVRALDAYHLDWCCGAQKTLAAACASAGAPLPDVLEALSREPDGAPDDLVAPSPNESLGVILTRIVSAHHAFSRAEERRLRELATKVMRRHGDAHPKMAGLAELVHGLFDELHAHMEREERVLFPYIEALERARAVGTAIVAPFGTVRAPIRMMMSDHDAAGLLLEDIARLTDRFTPPPEACGSWTLLYEGLRVHDADLRRHVWLENEVVFPRAIELEQRSSS